MNIPFPFCKDKMTRILQAAGGYVEATECSNGKSQLKIHKSGQELPSYLTLKTKYPLSLVEQILNVKGLDFLFDEIRREEDPDYVTRAMEIEILSYVAPADFAGKRILDFGCGSGASTIVLKRLFPDAQIVGVELRSDYLKIAAERVKFYNLSGVSFLLSPNSMSLPPNIGQFDAIILSAVFEHLLPDERPVLLSDLWSLIYPGGILFLRETPYRYAPVESHTTGLPFLNFLPDRLAHAVIRRYTRFNHGETWEEMLRFGIRGGTEREVIRILKSTPDAPILLDPYRNGITNRVELWRRLPTGRRFHLAKNLMKWVFEIVWRLTGLNITPQLSLALQKKG